MATQTRPRVPNRRPRGAKANGKRTQRQRPPTAPGEAERIAARRIDAMRLRKAGHSYRAIAARLRVDVATAWDDVQAELTALRGLTVKVAEDVRAIELQRLDDATLGLGPKIKKGDPKAVMAMVRVSDRRAKLLGLDAPQRREVTGADGAPLVPPADLSRLTSEELEALAALVSKAGRDDASV